MDAPYLKQTTVENELQQNHSKEWENGGADMDDRQFEKNFNELFESGEEQEE